MTRPEPPAPRPTIADTAAWTVRTLRAATPGLLAALLALTLAQGLLPAGLALALRGLINATVAARDPVGTGQEIAIFGWVALAFVLTAAEALGSLAASYANQRLVDDLNVRVTASILEHAWSLDLAFFEDPERQDLLSRTRTNVALHLQSFVTESLSTVRHVVTAAALVVVLAAIEPLVLVIPPFVLPFLWFQWKIAKARHAEHHQRATKLRWTEYFLEKLTSPDTVAELKLLDLGPLFIEKFRTLHSEFRDRDRALHGRHLLGASLAALLTIAALCGLFARVAYRAAAGLVSLGSLAVFGGVALRLRLSLNEAIRATSTWLEQLLAIASLREFLAVQPRVAGGRRLTPPIERGALDIRGVTFAYPGTSEPVLRQLSLSIRAGETLALVGESGAGKSTLVKLVAGLYEPSEGQILLDGVDIRDMAPSHLRRRMGLVLQSFACYEATAAENIAYGDWRRLMENQEEIEQLARAVNLHEIIRKLERGYDTHLGREFGSVTLSGGEWQRIAMARALARRGALLVLDEPTAHLDAGTEYEVFTRFKELASGRTTLLISHRFTTLGLADRIAVMAGGRIVETGGHQELLGRRGAYASLVQLYERMVYGSGFRSAAGE